MAFRHISEVLADARLTAGELAARGHDGAHKLVGEPSGVAQLPDAPTTGGMEMGGGPTKGGERQPALPVEGRPGKLNGKGRGAVKATASWGRAVKMPAHGGIAQASTTAHLRLIVRNDGRGLPHAAAKKGLARPGSRPSIRIVGGTHYTASGSF